jgi:transposase
MFEPAGPVRIYLCTSPADMRRSFDGLSAMVESILRLDPRSGHLFVFRNRRGDRLKILYWDRHGYALWYKRLEAGTFQWPTPADPEATHVSLREVDLRLILEGIDLQSVRRRKRYDSTHMATPAQLV